MDINYRSPLALAASLLLASSVYASSAYAAKPAPVDERIAPMKLMTVKACARGGNTAPGAPRNLKLVPDYCACVGEKYWQSVPQTEVDQLFSSGQSSAMEQREAERLVQARAACKR